MSSDWPTVRLGNYCLKIGSGSTPKGGAHVYLENGKYFLIRSQNIYNEGFKTDGLVYITEEAANKLKNVSIEENDILLNITGDSVARACLAKKNYLPARVNQHVAIVRPNRDELDPRFLNYLLVSPKMQNFLLSIASIGATRNALTKGTIESLEIPKPPLKTQKLIANQLISLDDKIELNTQTNQTLEQIAQAIFKSWFVDFDPVKAKMTALATGGSREDAERAAMCAISGKDETALDAMQYEQTTAYAELAATAALFPAAMQASELGDVPEGWEVTPVKSFGRIVTEKTPPKKIENSYSEHGIPFITPTDVNNEIFVTATGRHLSKEGQESIAKTEIRAGSICVTCIGSQMGKSFLSPTNAYTNQQINSIVVTEKIKVIYLLLNLRNRRGEIFLIGSSGSTMPIINKSTFEQLRVILPCNEVLKRFDKAVCHIIEQILQNSRQNIIFELLRDTLLPKLLSGEIDLSNLPDPAEVA